MVNIYLNVVVKTKTRKKKTEKNRNKHSRKVEKLLFQTHRQKPEHSQVSLQANLATSFKYSCSVGLSA
jgi:hypothetical protein